MSTPDGNWRPRPGESLERVEVTSVAALRAWLTDHYAQPGSVWLVTYKKAHPDRYVSRDEVLDELICFGWIDGARRALDAGRTMQLISPRRVQHWAQSHKDRAERLAAEGRMHESGLAAIEASRAAGLWDYMDDVDAIRVPADLAAALAAHPRPRTTSLPSPPLPSGGRCGGSRSPRPSGPELPASSRPPRVPHATNASPSHEARPARRPRASRRLAR